MSVHDNDRDEYRKELNREPEQPGPRSAEEVAREPEAEDASEEVGVKETAVAQVL